MQDTDDQTDSDQASHLHRFQEELASLLRRYKNQDAKTDMLLTFRAGSVIYARQLSVFLDLFTVAYNIGIAAFTLAKDSAGATAVNEEFIDNALLKVAESDEKGAFVDLEMEKISFQRHLAIHLTGLTTGLTLAVILSGTQPEVEPRGLSVSMATLDHAIATLKRALNDQ